MLNEDYRDMLQALVDEKVKFLLVGAYALAAHGYPRATMDIDIWVLPEPDNADAVLRALRRFGAPLHNLSREDLQKEGTVFQIGVAPRRIDIMTAASGLQFDQAFAHATAVDIEGIKVAHTVGRRSHPEQTGVPEEPRTSPTRKHWKTYGAPNQAFQATLDSTPERSRYAACFRLRQKEEKHVQRQELRCKRQWNDR